MLQALFYCDPFRQAVLTHQRGKADDLLSSLADLFRTIANHKRRSGYVSPKRFFQRLRHDNELFNCSQQQDAQEFLNYLLNHCASLLSAPFKAANGWDITSLSSGGTAGPQRTWIHDIFEGTLTNETKCMSCETVRTREESFLDLSLDIEQNSSITSCLRWVSRPYSMQDQPK